MKATSPDRVEGGIGLQCYLLAIRSDEEARLCRDLS